MAFLLATKKLNTFLLTPLLALVMLLLPASALASTYGSGSYGECAYSTGCPSSGSGSVPGTTPASEQPSIILLNDFSEYFTDAGKQITLEAGQSVYLDMVTGGVSTRYTITLTTVGDGYVDLTFSTASLNGRLNVGETKEYDLNGDGKSDISITLNSITDGKATFTFKAVLGASTTTQPNKSTTAPAAQAKGRSWLGLIFSILAIALALFIFFIFWWRRRKREQQPGPWPTS